MIVFFIARASRTLGEYFVCTVMVETMKCTNFLSVTNFILKTKNMPFNRFIVKWMKGAAKT